MRVLRHSFMRYDSKKQEMDSSHMRIKEEKLPSSLRSIRQDVQRKSFKGTPFMDSVLRLKRVLRGAEDP